MPKCVRTIFVLWGEADGEGILLVSAGAWPMRPDVEKRLNARSDRTNGRCGRLNAHCVPSAARDVPCEWG